ncbi:MULTISPECIES: hypothetical protein [unclassified Duganella]|uniref:hypothetical protein n=1 Tax=unclassified Duganella TaxID=2636909 RepID=UPI000E354288|nr:MULTISPECIES: hypothetical protein [unclassified Duganella]RFP09934.1 hypothetical protein D0T23_23320 [Duganella sp. BJB475]RFP25763.1 hypothetical protein D0T21_27290 [Duganella sp. BJB476]
MIDDLDLHDATLLTIDFSWAEATCVMTLLHARLADCRLTFTGVSNLTLSRNQPWGRSQSINSALERDKGQYEIEMQSGDVITIAALEVRIAGK